MRSIRFLSCAGMLLVCALVAAACSEPDSPLGPAAGEVSTSIDEAFELAMAKRFDEAVEALRPHVEKEKPETRALMLYARALLGSQRHSLAVWPLERVVERADAPPDANAVYGRALVYGGDELTAIDFLTEKLEDDPENVQLLEIRAQAYEAALDYERAVEDLEIVADERPGDARTVERLLNLLIKIEDWDSARERMNELGELLAGPGTDPEARASFCASSAQFEKERGNLDVAEEKLRGCLDDAPADPTLVFALEKLLDETDRVDEATAMFEALSEAFPKRQMIRQGFASRLARLGRVEDADALLLETAMNDGHQNSWLALANLRLSMSDLEGTVEALDKAVEAAMEKPVDDPELDWGRMDADSRFGIGDVYVRAGRYERAQRLIESLEKDEPAMALLLRARIKLEQGDPQGALDDYQEAFITFPSNPAARYLAGRAAVEVGEYDLALDLYQDSLRSDPTATDAGLVLSQMLLAEGKITWALDALSFQLARGGGTQLNVARVMARIAAAGGMHRFADSVRAEMSNDPYWGGIAAADGARDLVVLSGPERAREQLEKLEQLEEPAFYEGFWAWVALAMDTGAEDEARKRVAAYFERNQDHVAGWLIEGRMRYREGKLEEALAALDKAAELNPLNVAAHAEQGAILVDLGRLDDALIQFDRAAELDPEDPTAAFAAAEALFEARRYDEAEERLRVLLIAHPWLGRAALMVVDIEAAQGRGESELAYAMARQAARYYNACGPRAHFEFARLELARGNPESALVNYKKSIGALHNVANARYGMAQALVALGRDAEAIDELELAIKSPQLDESVVASALLEELKAKEATP